MTHPDRSVAFTARAREHREHTFAGAGADGRDLEVVRACHHHVAGSVGVGGGDCLWRAPNAAHELALLFSIVAEGTVAVETGDR